MFLPTEQEATAVTRAHHKRLLDDAGDFVESLGAALAQEDGPAIASYFGCWLTRHLAGKDG